MKPKTEQLIEAVETEVRKALDGISRRHGPSTSGMSEATYLDCVLEGIDLVVDPLKMRLEEVNTEED